MAAVKSSEAIPYYANCMGEAIRKSFELKPYEETMTENLSKEYLGVHLEPCGYKVLVMAPIFPQKRKSGLYLSSDMNSRMAKDSKIGKILAFGNECYLSKETFPKGPHTKIGDWVSLARFGMEVDCLNKKTIYWVHDNKFHSPLGLKDDDDVIKCLGLGGSGITLQDIENEMKKEVEETA